MSVPLRAIVSVCLLAGISPAQLTEDPATWTRADGLAVADIRATDLMAVMQASTLVLRAAAVAGKPRNEASGLASAAPRLLQSGNANLAWRVSSRLLAVAAGHTPGEWLDVAGAYDLHLDRAVLTPGTRLLVRLTPVFTLSGPLKGDYVVRVQVLDGEGKVIASGEEALPKQMRASDYSLDTTQLPEGRYRLRFELAEGEHTRLACERPFLIDGHLRRRLTALRAQVRQAQLRGPHAAGDAAALTAAEAAAANMENWLEGGPTGSPGWRLPFVETYAAPHLPRLSSPVPDEEGWRQAERFAQALAEGRPALEGMTGELRLAYRRGDAAVAYRLILPDAPAAAPRPLVVLRHSFLGDEGSWSHLGGDGLLAKLANQYQALILCPLEPLAFVDPNDKAAAALDAFIAGVTAAFDADPKRVFLAGHGTGAAEALIYGLGREPRFAAIAAVAGAPPRMFDMRPGAEVPALLLYSAKDEVAPERELRKWAAYVDTRLKKGKSGILEAASHAEIIGAALPRIFEFFFAPEAAPASQPEPAP